MTLELSHILTLFALALTGFNTLHNLVIRRLTTDKEIERRYQELHERMTLYEVRSKPMWDHMERRLAEILHQPDHYAMDALLERFSDDPDAFTADELQALIDHVYEWYREVRPGGPRADATQALAATLFLAGLDGRQALLREQRQQRVQTAWTTRQWERRWLGRISSMLRKWQRMWWPWR